jgi:hypothetical protein
MVPPELVLGVLDVLDAVEEDAPPPDDDDDELPHALSTSTTAIASAVPTTARVCLRILPSSSNS